MKAFIAFLDSLILGFMGRFYKEDGQVFIPSSPVLPIPPAITPPPMPTTPPQAPDPAPSAPQSPALRFDTPVHAYHAVRAICDAVGLTFAQKEILSACVMQESGFLANPKPNVNRDKSGNAWSTDYGIVQVNDYWNIGPGKPFPSVQYVIQNPGACVRWMAHIMKATGKLNAWASYTSGAYKKHLLPGSKMRQLAAQYAANPS